MKSDSLTLQGKSVLFLWKWLNVWTALATFAFGYAGFVWLTKGRFIDPNLRSRMFVFATLVNSTTKPAPPADFLAVLSNAVAEASTTKIQLVASNPTSYRLPDFSNQVAIAEALSLMSSNGPPSYAFTANVKKLLLLLTNVQEREQEFRQEPGLSRVVQKFTHDDLRLNGVDFREPEGNINDLHKDAASFLAHRDLFHGSGKQVPSEFKLRPWRLLRFYDVRRVLLNETIPLAFATLLLACGFFLEMRFSDYSRSWVWRRDDSLKYREQFEESKKEPETGKWVPLWEESKISGPTVVSLFNQRHFWKVVLGLNALALFIEYFLQNPQKRAEWIINTPIMIGTATALAVLLLTLTDLGKLRINPELSRFSIGFRKRLFRPLILGTGSLFIVSVWGIFYSVVELAGLSGIQMVRACIQVALCLGALWLLIRLLVGIEGQLGKLPSDEQREVPEKIEEKLNRSNNFSLLNTVLPDVDERLVKAAAVGLIPLLSVLHSLL